MQRFGDELGILLVRNVPLHTIRTVAGEVGPSVGTLYFQSPVGDKGPYPPFSLGIHIRSIHKVAVDAVKHHGYLLEDKGGGIIEVEAVEIACKSLSAP